MRAVQLDGVEKTEDTMRFLATRPKFIGDDEFDDCDPRWGRKSKAGRSCNRRSTLSGELRRNRPNRREIFLYRQISDDVCRVDAPIMLIYELCYRYQLRAMGVE